MRLNEKEFLEILSKPECYNLEFKEAKNTYSTEKLFAYCSALANERGGTFILGVTNDKKLVGTNSFLNIADIEGKLYQKLSIKVECSELTVGDKRILIFDIPSRPPAQTISVDGISYMRAGESLVKMDDVTYKNIITEVINDHSAEFVEGLKFEDLNIDAVRKLKNMWAKKVGREDFLHKSDEDVLDSLCLRSGTKYTIASLILLGSDSALQKFLPDCEIILEWRQIPNKITHDYRRNWRKPFLLIFDEIWDELNKRNIRTPFQEGFFQRDIYAFNEKTIREAVLNAVVHRDYKIKGSSIFIKASPESFSIESPGGFLQGVTPENVISAQKWRNRLLAETLEKAGLVERAGQGIDDIFYSCIADGKGTPDFSGTDNYKVVLNIPSVVKDPRFILYLEKIINDKQVTLSTQEIMELESIRTNKNIKDVNYKNKFISIGLIERIGAGKGTSYILSHNYYKHSDNLGVYTKLVGLKRVKYKEMILEHIRKNGKGTTKEFQVALPELSAKDISNILSELKSDKKIIHTGGRHKGAWVLVKN